MACVEELYPHICMLRGLQYVTPSFAKAAQGGGKVFAYARNIIQVQLPTTVNIPPDWLKLNNSEVPIVEVLDRALAMLPPGVTRMTEQTLLQETLLFQMVSIAPLELVYPPPCLPSSHPCQYMSPTHIEIHIDGL